MDISEQNQDANETEFAQSSTSSPQLIVPSQNSRQLAVTRWHSSGPPYFMGLNFPQGPFQIQTSYPQTYPPNISVQNFFLMQPYPTGRYASSHQTRVEDRSIYPPFSINPLSFAGPSSIMNQQRRFYQQETLPPNSYPTPTQYIESTPSSYPSMIQSSNHAALSLNRNDSASLPTISELPTPEIVNRETINNDTAAAINNVQSEIFQSPLTVDGPSNANHSVSLETLNQEDAISEGPLLNDEPSHSSDVEALKSLFDEIIAEEWKHSVSTRIMNGLLTSNSTTSNSAGRDPIQDPIIPPSDISPPAGPSNPQMQINQAQHSPVPSFLKNTPSPPTRPGTLIPHTPLYQQQRSPTTPSSANANRSTIARDVLRALRPPSTKRKRVESEQNSPLFLSKRTKTGEISNQPVTGTAPNGFVAPGVSMYGTSAPSTSNTPLGSVHTQSLQTDLPDSNLVSTFPVPETDDMFKSTNNNVTGIQTEIFQDLDASENNTSVSHIVSGSHPIASQSSSPMPNGHRTSTELGDPSPHPPASPPSPGLSLNNIGEGVDVQTDPLLTRASPAQGHPSTKEVTASPLMEESDMFTQRPPTFDQMERITSLSPGSPSQTPSETLPARHDSNSKPSLSLNLSTISQNRMPLFLPSESPSPTDENINIFSGELPILAKSPTDEPSSSTLSRKTKNRAYVLIPQIRKRKLSVQNNKLTSSQTEGRGKRAVEPELPEVEESRCRLTERRCLWRDCRAVLDSAEKLIKHTKIAHGGATDQFYKCRWTGCTRLGTYFTSEDLTRHLKGHVHLLITCPYKGCVYETDQGKKLVSHIATKHDNQQDVLKPSALPNQLFPQYVMQPSETCPAYYSIPIPVTAGLISKERHHRLGPLIRAHIVGKLKPNKHSIGTRGSTNDLTSLTTADIDYAFQLEEPSKAFSTLKQMSPVINEIDVLEGNLLNGVIIMGMGNSTPSLPVDNVAVDVGFQRATDTHEGLGTDLGPNLLQTAREERDFLEVEALL